MKLSKSKIAAEIRDTFERNFCFLKPRHQAHFLVRLYRISGDDTLVEPIAQSMETALIRMINLKDSVSDRQAKMFGESILKSQKPRGTKFIARHSAEKENPRILFDFYCIEQLFKLKSFGLSQVKPFNKVYQKLLAFIDRPLIYKEMFNEEIMTKDSTNSVISIHYLKMLGLKDETQKLEKHFKELASHHSRLPGYKFENLIYGLAHFIISGSMFYQKPINPRKYKWILEFFDKNIDKLLKNGTPDIVAEIGVCYKLCGTKNVTTRKMDKYLLSKYSRANKMFIRERKTPLGVLEHRNILAFMLFTPWEGLRKGPNLSKTEPIKRLQKNYS